jgi:hypothetical protein
VFDQLVPVNKERHAGKKVRASNDFHFASNFHVAYVTVHEFARAAAIYLSAVERRVDWVG